MFETLPVMQVLLHVREIKLQSRPAISLRKVQIMFNSFLRRISIPALGFVIASYPLFLAAQPQQATSRSIVVNLQDSTGPVDRFFDLSVGSDYPGTLIRDDSQAQLKLTVDELGFRYIRFHAIFHDVLKTVRVEDGKTTYDWAKIDQLYDDLLARH